MCATWQGEANLSDILLRHKVGPRIMMMVMTAMYIRVIEWGISLEDISTQQSAMISVVSGSMTGAFAVWLGSEKK